MTDDKSVGFGASSEAALPGAPPGAPSPPAAGGPGPAPATYAVLRESRLDRRAACVK